MTSLRLFALLLASSVSLAAQAGEITVSAAASLSNAFKDIAPLFEAAHPGSKVQLNFGASGALLAQIAKGAPADVFVSADDYLTKPFSPRELLARIRALLRRARARETVADSLARVRAYRFAGWELGVRLRRLKTPTGETVPLTNTEFNLLVAFLAAPQRILTREQLLDLSRLHNDEVYDRAIDVQVGRLRKKMELRGSTVALIRTERGAGYAFMAVVETIR